MATRKTATLTRSDPGGAGIRRRRRGRGFSYTGPDRGRAHRPANPCPHKVAGDPGITICGARDETGTNTTGFWNSARRCREQAVAEDQVCAVVRSLKRRRGGEQLLAYRTGKRWHDVSARDINAYLGEISGGDYTARGFRTWHGTVLAAVGLAVSQPAASSENGITIAPMLADLGEGRAFGDLATRGRAESAVVRLLARHRRRPAGSGRRA